MRAALPFATVTLLSVGCAPEHEVFQHDGLEREYLLHVPEDLPEGAPLVMFLHGYEGKAWQYRWYLNFDEVADKHGFAVAYPQGTEDDSGTTHWNARLSISDTDDLGFLKALTEHLQDSQGFDPERTFVGGISNGGFMSYAMACEHSELYRGAASVIGIMSGETWRTCDPTVPLPIFQLHGEQDDLVFMDGSMSEDGGWGGAPHLDEIMDFWVQRNECAQSTPQDIVESVTATHHTECLNDNEVWYYKFAELAHEFPMGDDESGLNAMEMMGEFFMKF